MGRKGIIQVKGELCENSRRENGLFWEPQVYIKPYFKSDM